LHYFAKSFCTRKRETDRLKKREKRAVVYYLPDSSRIGGKKRRVKRKGHGVEGRPSGSWMWRS